MSLPESKVLKEPDGKVGPSVACPRGLRIGLEGFHMKNRNDDLLTVNLPLRYPLVYCPFVEIASEPILEIEKCEHARTGLERPSGPWTDTRSEA